MVSSWETLAHIAAFSSFERALNTLLTAATRSMHRPLSGGPLQVRSFDATTLPGIVITMTCTRCCSSTELDDATARPASSNGDRKTVDGASRSCGDADLLRLLEGAPAGPQERLSVRPFSALASKVVNKRIPFDLVRSPSPSIYIEYSNILLYTSQSLLPVTTADWTGAVILYEGESISKQFTFTSRCRSPDV
jgi:hypothetical protein